jgi:hypothetical protein
MVMRLGSTAGSQSERKKAAMYIPKHFEGGEVERSRDHEGP